MTIATREVPSQPRLQGKVALITGSSRGIGAAIARRFASEGAAVALHGRDREALTAVRRGIEARGGRAAAARRPTALTPAAYAAAKAGIQTLTQLVAAQVGPGGIRANCIAPETILTEENEMRIPDVVKKKLVEEHPVRRLGTPEDVAEAALFLASDASAWISGVVLDVAGGSVMR